MPDPDLDPDLAAHLARERAFAVNFSWPPEESVTDARPRKLLQPWSIDREAALRAMIPDAVGDQKLEIALITLWLSMHTSDAITLLRVQSLARQFQTVQAWCRANVLVSERDAVMKLADAVFDAADQNKTLPAHEGGGDRGNV